MKRRIVWPVLLIVVFALSRWPNLMPPNFSAAYAISFCAGLYLPGRRGWIIPLCVLAGSDLLINLIFYHEYGFSVGGFIRDMAPGWLAYAGSIALGKAFGPKRPLWMLTEGGLIAAILFYLVTNTASWLSLSYAKTLAGWIQALTIGLPNHPPTWKFFRNTLLSGGLFTGLFVGAIKLTEAQEATKEKEEPVGDPDPEPAKPEMEG